MRDAIPDNRNNLAHHTSGSLRMGLSRPTTVTNTSQNPSFRSGPSPSSLTSLDATMAPHSTPKPSPARARNPMAKNTRCFRFRYASRGAPPIGQPRLDPSAPNPESGQQSPSSYPIPIAKGRRPKSFVFTCLCCPSAVASASLVVNLRPFCPRLAGDRSRQQRSGSVAIADRDYGGEGEQRRRRRR
jgi:hypothetical protein